MISKGETVMSENQVVELTPEEQWAVNSVAPLLRKWGGRCITCQFWEPLAKQTHGRCQQIVSDSTNDEIALYGKGESGAETRASFGCTLCNKCEPDGLIERAALGIELGMLTPMPDPGT